MLQEAFVTASPRETALPQPFECRRIEYAQTVRIVVTGELDVATVPELDDALRQAEGDAPLIVLDLLRLDFVASSGLRVLLEAHARIRRAGGRLYVANAPADLFRMLELIGAVGALELDARRPAARIGGSKLRSVPG